MVITQNYKNESSMFRSIQLQLQDSGGQSTKRCLFPLCLRASIVRDSAGLLHHAYIWDPMVQANLFHLGNSSCPKHFRDPYALVGNEEGGAPFLPFPPNLAKPGTSQSPSVRFRFKSHGSPSPGTFKVFFCGPLGIGLQKRSLKVSEGQLRSQHSSIGGDCGRGQHQASLSPSTFRLLFHRPIPRGPGKKSLKVLGERRAALRQPPLWHTGASF